MLHMSIWMQFGILQCDKMATIDHDFDFEQFRHYLQGVGGNKFADTKSILNNVGGFLNGYYHRSSLTTPTDLLLNRKVLENYHHQLKKNQPTTMTEKLRRIRMAINFVMHENDDDDLYIKGKRTMDMISW